MTPERKPEEEVKKKLKTGRRMTRKRKKGEDVEDE